jgi:predicted Zn-dependent protease
MKRMMMAAAFTVTLGACGVSTQQEVQMGQQYSQQINAQLPIVRDPEINRYINVLGDSIARGADNRNLEWHFYVVDSKEVNAFAVPGGFIYINRGLIERATSMDQVAGVLGHEIGHVTERHSVQQMRSSSRRTSA